jgi:hypothetical protein
MLTLPELVDAFVEKINSEPREPEPCNEVPESLRVNPVVSRASGESDAK